MKQGDLIPEYLGIDENGNKLYRKDFAGQKLILYFYPKDNTPGCTAEACSLRDHYKDLTEEGYTVIGVSSDNESSHQKFITKHELPFHLIADTDHKLQEEMGVWGEKTLAGRKYMGTLRTTFLVNPDGTIARIFTPKEIKTKIHAEQILG